VLGIFILAIGLDTFLIEPHWLQVTHLRIATSKVDRPVRIALIADIQIDSPGPYEAMVLSRVMAERPDLILLAGDYIQVRDPGQYTPTIAVLNAVFRQANLTAPLGIYAVQGNIDRPPWQEIFAGLPITCIEKRTQLDLGPVVLSGLSSGESYQSDCRVSAQDKFHIVLGHSPNFSLGQVDADLLLAGDTHGGQVRLPGIGPLLTFSKVPRSWASGKTEIDPTDKVGTRVLVVSRGIGLERNDAPRMRFLCRPELIILDVTPKP
jgi:predicted MPP superfamily phosphohydrolase